MVIIFSINGKIKSAISVFSLFVIIAEWKEWEIMIGFKELQRNWLELIEISLLLYYCQHLLSAVALSRQVMKVPTDGDFAPSLGTSSAVTLLVKLFLMSKLNLPSHILWSLIIIHFIVSPSSDKTASSMLCHLFSGPFWYLSAGPVYLLTWEWEYPLWDTVFRCAEVDCNLICWTHSSYCCSGCGLSYLQGEHSVGSYSAWCLLVLFSWLLPSSQCLDARGWPSQVQNITLHWYS